MNFWQWAGSYWWLVFPLSGVVGGWIGGVAKYNEKRRQDKIEMLRLKSAGKAAAVEQKQTRDSQIDRALAAHDEVNRRWFDYEIDIATLIDFPMMIDMREPLTVDFHRAKRVADSLRPTSREELHDPAVFTEYRDAVRDYEVAFDIAEREAKRRRRTGFSDSERESLERARKLVSIAADSAATPAERQAAYRKARSELDGLIVLPDAAMAEIERRIAGAIESGIPTAGSQAPSAGSVALGRNGATDLKSPNPESAPKEP
ncbi:hypothetical protein [Nakamurella lactea]|uniref:hypothetical protein n=1 Tax=Nakamurella lactea TaxID=459515 RepID=UPI0004109C2E|nr:hypothetical protein [Nakamurella lactea]